MTTSIVIDTPFLSIKEYARRTNQAVDTVRKDIESGLIPVYQQAKGKKRLVNMIALARIADSLCAPLEPWNQPHQVASLDSY